MPPFVVTQTSPPPKSPWKPAITVFESFGSIATAAPTIGPPCGGVMSVHDVPPLVERIRFTAWPPPASVTPIQIVSEFDGSIATSNTSSLFGSTPVSVWCVHVTPSSVELQTASCVAAQTLPSGANSMSCTLRFVKFATGAHVTPSSVERYIVPPQLPPGATPASTTPAAVGDAATSATSPPGGPSRLQLPVPTPAGAGALAEAKRVARACAPRSSLFTLSPSRMSACGVIALSADGGAAVAAPANAAPKVPITNDRQHFFIRTTLCRMRVGIRGSAR